MNISVIGEGGFEVQGQHWTTFQDNLFECEGIQADLAKRWFDEYRQEDSEILSRDDFMRFMSESYPQQDAEGWWNEADSMRRGALERINFLAFVLGKFGGG